MRNRAKTFASTLDFFAFTQANAQAHYNYERYYIGNTEARTNNKGFKEIVGTVVNQTFVHLSKFVSS